MLSQVGETQADWLGHVIVCGLPGVGLPIVEELTLSGVPAVVIDDDPAPALARMIAAWGVPLITGQARAEETLISAGLAGAIAVICAQENDLSALETALLVRRLRAEVRVIAQLANPAVGRAVREAGVAVLDVAGLSAPSVVEVCLGEGVQELSLSGMRFLAARTTAPHAATLRELYGALAPVAVVPPTGDVLVCPGRDTRVSAGDEVTLIGTPDELAAVSVIDHPERIRRLAATAGPGGNGAGATAGPPGILGVLGGEDPDALPAGPSPAGRALRWLRDLAVSFARAADRRMAIALGALLAVLVTATLVLHFTYRLAGPGHRISLLESVYFTVETVTTVGYGDYTFRGEPAWLIIFAIGLMITGALFVAVFFALVTNMLVSRRIEESLGLQKIVALRGHVLVIGLGTIGLRVVRKLHDLGREVAVIEKDEHNRHLSQVARAPRPGDDRRRDAARGPRVGPAGRRVGGRGADQRRPGQPGDRSRRPRPARVALARGPGGAADLRPAARPFGQGDVRVQERAGRPPPWPRPGSSAPRSASTCSPRSTPATSRCWSPG